MKSFEEIMLSKEFMAYMNGEDKQYEGFREEFIRENPEKENEFDKACLIYKALTIHKKYTLEDSVKDKKADALIKRINAYEQNKTGNRRLFLWRHAGIAAAIILFICMAVPAGLYIHEQVNSPKLFNEISVPSGEKSILRLSDGTIIWLNSESKLKYPANFQKGNREVILEGEGYFDVAKLKGSTFIVKTQDIQVIALGTKFNIKSYPEEKFIETTLVEGRVRLQQISEKQAFNDIILLPDERAVYSKEVQTTEIYEKIEKNSATNKEDMTVITGIKKNQPISVNKVNTSNITCWKDHLLVFDNETLEEIAVKMSRWYNIQVNIDDKQLKEHRFTGKFINNETFYQVLEAINLTTPIEYVITDNRVNIKERHKKQKR